jgi:peptide chain release factor subunit 1
VVDREKARIFLVRMGRIDEEQDMVDDVPGQHDQGGWSQSRYSRHIEEHAAQHLKRVAERLLKTFERRRFDRLILAGPDELIPEFERGLHDYLKRCVIARINLPMTASPDHVLERSLGIEEGLAFELEQAVVERLTAEAAAGRNAVLGLQPVLDALNEARVDTFVVPFGLFADGRRCMNCGRLALSGDRCSACGGATGPVPDVVESAVAAALGQGASVETLTLFNADSERGFHDVGALLRY